MTEHRLSHRLLGRSAAAGRGRPAEAFAPTLGEDDLRGLETTFAPRRWLRDAGRTAWLLVGVILLVVGLVWLLGTTAMIVGPLIAATVVAAVAMPLVSALDRRRVPRAAGAAIVLLGLVTLAVVLAVLVIGGISSQSSAIAQEASHAADRASSWLTSVGVSDQGAAGANESVKQAAPQVVSSLSKGVIAGVKGLTSLAFALSLTALSLFFLLKDGPSLRTWVDGHLGVPRPVAQTVTGGVIRSLRGYFRGVTIVAVFNAVVVALGALILGVPLAGTIAVLTFVTAYIPYIGAFVAGAFAVVVALGAKGAATAVVMLVIVLLANGLLQNLMQPFAMGSALGLHPLVVLVVTIGAGCIFGTFGLILAAPLTSAAVHVTGELALARTAAQAEPEAGP